MTEALGALSVAAVTLGLAVAWLAWTAIRLDTASPDRLVAELRLSQVSALVLVLVAGVYVGAAVANETIPGVGLDIALATGFFVIAALATTSEPSRALMVLAAAWGAHALVDLGHLAEVLPQPPFRRGTRQPAPYTMSGWLAYAIFRFSGGLDPSIHLGWKQAHTMKPTMSVGPSPRWGGAGRVPSVARYDGPGTTRPPTTTGRTRCRPDARRLPPDLRSTVARRSSPPRR